VVVVRREEPALDVERRFVHGRSRRRPVIEVDRTNVEVKAGVVAIIREHDGPPAHDRCALEEQQAVRVAHWEELDGRERQRRLWTSRRLAVEVVPADGVVEVDRGGLPASGTRDDLLDPGQAPVLGDGDGIEQPDRFAPLPDECEVCPDFQMWRYGGQAIALALACSNSASEITPWAFRSASRASSSAVLGAAPTAFWM
jgi:hypothetical protein